MSTKMKGLLKGLRYISQIFDDEKEPEMQIGYPTDVKHVAHIGWDGPSVESPNWMKEFNSPGFLGATGEPIENSEIKSVSEDSSRRSTQTPNSPARDLPELPKSSRRRSSTGNSVTAEESPSRESSTKSRQSRRHQSKDSSDSTKPRRQPLDPSLGPESPSKNLPDIPKKSRRKKSKDSMKDSTSGGSTRPSRSKGNNTTSTTYTSPFSDPGPDTESILRSQNNHELYQTSSMKSPLQEEEKGSSGIS